MAAEERWFVDARGGLRAARSRQTASLAALFRVRGRYSNYLMSRIFSPMWGSRDLDLLSHRGRYGAKVEVTSEDEPRNRVSLNIEIVAITTVNP